MWLPHIIAQINYVIIELNRYLMQSVKLHPICGHKGSTILVHVTKNIARKRGIDMNKIVDKKEVKGNKNEMCSRHKLKV